MRSAAPINVNLARIVFRLLTNKKGWRIDLLQQELSIAPRTYRKYRKILTEEFTPFLREDGTSMVEEVKEGEARYLRLVHLEETAANQPDFVPRIAAMYFAQQLMGFLAGTNIEDAFQTLSNNFAHSLADRPFVLGHLLRNVDRIFYQVPDAPKDYSAKGDELNEIAHALIFTKVLRITYNSPSHGELEMILYPYSLMSYRSGLYLVARSEKHGSDPRIYSVDRILDVERLDRSFEYPSSAQFHPQSYTEGSFGIFRGDPTRIFEYELIFDDVRWLKMFVRERRWHPTQRFDELADGRLRMTFRVSATDEVERWIRSFGDEVEVTKNGVEID